MRTGSGVRYRKDRRKIKMEIPARTFIARKLGRNYEQLLDANSAANSGANSRK